MEQRQQRLLIGISGRTASGKTSLARLVQSSLQSEGHRVGIIEMDNFYRELNQEEHSKALENEYNFDDLSAFDLPAFLQELYNAKSGQPVRSIGYDHATHQHTSVRTTQSPADVWVVEGLYLFADSEIASIFDLKIFMDVDADTSLTRRLRRDCVERKRNVEGVLDQYERFVQPAFHRLVEPSRIRSDITIHRGVQNIAALDAVLTYIRGKVPQQFTLSDL
jgi:uridine kinase